MVEESTAAAHALKSEVQDLTTMVDRFDIDGNKHREPARNNSARAVQAKIAKGVAPNRSPC